MSELLKDIELLFLAEVNGAREIPEENNLLVYKEKMIKNELINIMFEQADISGNLFKREGGVTIRMNAEYDAAAFQSSKNLTNSLCVKIIAVNEESKTVFVSHRKAKEEMKPAILCELNQCLKAGTSVAVMGRVLRVQKKATYGEEIQVGVWLDLCGVGIAGFVPIKDWEYAYVKDLEEKAVYGDIIKIKINGKKLRSKSTLSHFICSHKEFNMAENFPILLQINDTIIVSCTTLRKQNWIGTIDDVREYNNISFQGNYTNTVQIIPGMKYQGTITKIRQEKRLVQFQVEKSITMENLFGVSSRGSDGDRC